VVYGILKVSEEWNGHNAGNSQSEARIDFSNLVLCQYDIESKQ
jgi:hypothetical protein